MQAGCPGLRKTTTKGRNFVLRQERCYYQQHDQPHVPETTSAVAPPFPIPIVDIVVVRHGGMLIFQKVPIQKFKFKFKVNSD